MSAQVTISLPLETIAAIQSNDASRLTPETIANVTLVLIRAAKALPVDLTQRRDSHSPFSRTALTTVTTKTPSIPSLSAAQGISTVQKRGNGDVKSEGESGDAVMLEVRPRSTKFRIQIMPRGQPRRKLTLLVRPSYTIRTVKELVSETWTEFPTSIQRLMRPNGRGRSLDEDSRTLQDVGTMPKSQIQSSDLPSKYYLENGDVLYIETRRLLRNLQRRAAKDHAKVTIFVGTFSGRTLAFDIPLSTTVGQMKILIQHREGVPVYRQRLLFGKFQLTEGLSAWEEGYHTSHHRTLKLVSSPESKHLNALTETAVRCSIWRCALSCQSLVTGLRKCITRSSSVPGCADQMASGLIQ